MPIFKSLYDSTRKNHHGASGNRTPDLPLSRRTPEPLGQRGGITMTAITTMMMMMVLLMIMIGNGDNDDDGDDDNEEKK